MDELIRPSSSVRHGVVTRKRPGQTQTQTQTHDRPKSQPFLQISQTRPGPGLSLENPRPRPSRPGSVSSRVWVGSGSGWVCDFEGPGRFLAPSPYRGWICGKPENPSPIVMACRAASVRDARPVLRLSEASRAASSSASARLTLEHLTSAPGYKRRFGHASDHDHFPAVRRHYRWLSS